MRIFGVPRNPVRGELFIETDYTGFQTLEFFDINGKSLLSQEWDESPVDFQPFPAGTYFVRLYDEQFVKTIKIMKQ
ncbi:MAG: T9SS type A sorting domain-containing protein [Saprospiraceae bacterium]|nr:T9SS type A sorting domain-containing protein [Saprospiraceae bacterium]